MPRLNVADQHPPRSAEDAHARREAVRDRLWSAGRTNQAPGAGSVPAERRHSRDAIAEIVDGLSVHLRISTAAVLTDIRDPVAIEARRIAAALSVLWLKLPRSEVAEHFGIIEEAVTDGLNRANGILLRHAIPARAPRLDALGLIVHELLADGLSRAVSIRDIQQTICEAFDVGQHELVSARRSKAVVLPRQLAMALAKRFTARSLPDIGRHFGGRDHTTVMHAIRKVAPIMARAEAALPPGAGLAEWVSTLKACAKG